MNDQRWWAVLNLEFAWEVTIKVFCTRPKFLPLHEAWLLNDWLSRLNIYFLTILQQVNRQSLERLRTAELSCTRDYDLQFFHIIMFTASFYLLFAFIFVYFGILSLFSSLVDCGCFKCATQIHFVLRDRLPVKLCFFFIFMRVNLFEI